MGLVQNRGMWDAYRIRGQQVIIKKQQGPSAGDLKGLGATSRGYPERRLSVDK